MRDTLDTLTIQSHDIIWIRHGAAAHKNKITPRLFDSGLSNNAKCVSQPASICHPVMHSEPLSPSVCLDVTSLSRAIVTWCRYLTECQPDTDWHWHLSSPLPRCCHVHQARPPDQLSRGAQLGTGQPVAWDAATQATIQRRERGHTIRSCQLKLQSFQLWADFNNNSQHLRALNLLGLVINDSIWTLNDKNLSVWTLRLNKNKTVLDLCTALTWVSWVRVMTLIITVVSVTVRSLWNIKGPCCPYRETRKYFLYLWTIWVFRLAALVSLRGREEISLTCLEMLQMPAKTQHNKLAMF